MAALAQLALSFDEPEHLLYHHPSRGGFVSVWSPKAVDGPRQKSVQLADLTEHLKSHEGQPDRYISAGVFYLPNRRTVSLSRMPMAFADLDTYKVPRLRKLSPESLLDELQFACSERMLPVPSVTMFSGRGLQLKWLLAEPVKRADLPRWAALQRSLNSMLTDFGADAGAIDASRVLRLEGSVSSRSGKTVRVLHRATTPTMGGELLPSGVVGYDFEGLADELLPVAHEEPAGKRTQKVAERAKDTRDGAAREAVRANLTVVEGGLSEPSTAKRKGTRLIPSMLAWDRLEDLRTLTALRGHDHGLPPGQRNEFVFLAACFLAQAVLVRNLRAEIDTLAAKVFAPDWQPWEVRSCVSSVLSRAEAQARGEVVEFGGRKRDPRYDFKTETLVQRLGVTNEEARHLRTILPGDEVRRRDAERHEAARRAAGVITRAEYEQRSADKREQVRALSATGCSNSAIARELGIPRTTVIGYLKD